MQFPSRNAPTSAASPIFCEGHARFTDVSSIHTFRVQNETIALRHDPDVFPPSAFGLKFAEFVDFAGCGRAADIGTGTGLLAILAAKKGVPEVKATDTSPLAVKLADYNARVMNSTDVIETMQGHFFCNCTGSFDLITANLPQEIIPPAYGSVLSSLQSGAIDGGGEGGNAILLEFLDVAPSYMHHSTKLYIIVNTITDYKMTLNKIAQKYDARLVWEGIASAKAFVRENGDFFRQLVHQGIVDLVEDECGNWHARQFIYQLTLPL